MKRGICFAAVVLLIFGTSTSFVNAAGTVSASMNAAVPTGSAITATGGAVTTGGAVSSDPSAWLEPAIRLSVKDAVKIMQTTGTRAETAALNKQEDKALATGYGENVKKISKVLDGLNAMDSAYSLYSSYFTAAQTSEYWDKSEEAQDAGASTTNKKIMQLRRDFAKGQIENNYQSEMNQIEYDTLKVYYGVLLAQDNLKTEQNNLKTQQDILKNTKAQYEVGMLAKKDVLSAQSAVTAAESSVRAAATKLDYARMSFNFLLGYPVMQKVDFTDSLDVVSTPAIDLNASIENALEKRSEIKGAEFAAKIHKILLESLKGYSRSSSIYMEEEIALKSVEKKAKDAPAQIEIDLRNKAAALDDKKAALESARAMKAYAEEGYRLISISYDAGMTTLAELQQAQANVYKAGLGVSAAISDYDLAVYEFKYAQDVGTYRLPL